jgi:hypothetical protein
MLPIQRDGGVLPSLREGICLKWGDYYTKVNDVAQTTGTFTLITRIFPLYLGGIRENSGKMSLRGAELRGIFSFAFV